ncbi:putative efflux transporter [Lentinula detonsa]|uniref:Efflux transporter n=1 Tax=Lentinula detonsa TaxID=2804962 RepID=A0A9W8P5F6_9AGAR|nr:putative efflux transporter [Lentinula detonsa]
MASKDEPEHQLGSQNEGELERISDIPLWQTILLITSCTLAMLTTTASNSAVSIALPTMENDLEIPQAALDWVVAANPLSNGCLLLLFGRLADLYGRKKVFLVGSLWLVAFTLGCAFAQDPLTLDILRGFQGLGSAATIPASLGILAHSFPPGRTRAIAFATFAAGAPLGGGTGVIFGGLLTELTSQSWRSPFYLVAGITVLSMTTAMVSFNPDHPSTEEDQRVDWIGASLVTTGLVLIVFVLGQGEVAPKQWSTPYIIALLIVGVVFVLLFIVWQYHLERIQDAASKPYPTSGSRFAPLSLLALHCLPTAPPIMKVSLWTRARGRVAVVFCIACLNWCCFQGWNYWVVLYYQNYVGYSPLRTTVRMVPMFVTGLICNGFVALFIGHIPMTILVAAGTALTGCSALLFAVINPNAVYWAFGFPSAIIAVIGADFVFACGTMYVAKKCLPHEQSVGGAVFQTMTQLGTAVGVTVSTVVFDRVLESRAADNGIDVSNSTGSSEPGWLTLPAYKAAMWSCFAFGMCACLLTILFLRVGIIGHRIRPSRSPTMTEDGEGTVTNSARQSAEKEKEKGLETANPQSRVTLMT